MALKESVIAVTLEAQADLSLLQHRFMGLLNGRVTIPDPGFLNTMPIGVLANRPTAQGQPALIEISGIVKVVAAGAITPGTRITADTQGRAAAVASGQPIYGQALSETAAAGELVEVIFRYEGTAA